MNLDVELADARLQALLHVGHGLVVDERADLFEEETEQAAGGDVADLLAVAVLGEPALDRRNCLLARVLVDLDRYY